MKISNKGELKAVFQEMLAEFIPSEKAPQDKQFIRREFECKDPEARAARTLSQISAELVINAVCPIFMADSTEAQGIDPQDICEIIVRMYEFPPILETDDDGIPIEPEHVLEPAHWVPAYSVAFRPTNGWTPEWPLGPPPEGVKT